MQTELFESEKLKPIFSGHETFPLRYGWLKKSYDTVLKAKKEGFSTKEIFYDAQSIAVFGVGKNMVSSIRHWSIYMGIIENYEITDLANIFLADEGLDPWMEYPTTLWLFHWYLVRQPSLVTYYWFFNYYNGLNFDRKLLNDEINTLCETRNWKKPSPTTLKRDIECFIRMYVSRNNHNDEESMESPLSELDLIKVMNKNDQFSPNRGKKINLSINVFLLVLVTFWEDYFSNVSALSFESLMYDPESPGRIFLLDENSLLEKIYLITEKYPEIVNWSETAGLKQFTKSANYSFADLKNFAFQNIKDEYLTK